MLRMAFEREVIMNIRYRVDAYDEQCLFDDESSGLNADESVVRSHVQLGSLEKIIHLGSYAKKLGNDICLQDLQKLLTTFLHLNHVFDVEDNAISDFKVCDLRICWWSAHACIGGPLSCIAGHIRLPGDSNKED